MNPPPPLRWLHPRTRILYLLALLGIAAPWISRAVADVATAGWLVDLGTHWQWLYVPAAMFSAIVAWQGFARVAALLVLGFGLYGLWVVMPPLAAGAVDAEAAGSPPAQHLRVVSANVLYTTDDPSGLISWARLQRADVILLQEISPDYAAALEQQVTGFPHRHLAPRKDPFGVGIVSRYPLKSTSIIDGPGGIPMLAATVDAPGGAVPVLVAHPAPPLSERLHRDRATTLRQIDARARSNPALVVAGDFNATPWSSAFAGVGALGIASRGLPTWREVLPIDHVLVGPGWALVMADRGLAGGSDHRPLVVELQRVASAP